MKQRTTEWIENIDLNYHERQFDTPYQSTIAFCDWLEEIGYINKDSQFTVIDLASGQGANTYYLAQRYKKSKFIGIDINSELVLRGNKYLQDKGIKNCYLEVGDIYRLEDKYISEIDAIVSFQTLSWLPEFKEPLAAMTKLKSKWIALTSLFYDGPISCTINVTDYDPKLYPIKESFYNIYSLPVVKEYMSELGYNHFESTPFEIGLDLPKPITKGRGTFTEKLENGRRLQISGPLLLPWNFIAVKSQ